MTTEEIYESYFAALRSGSRSAAFDVVDRACRAGTELTTLYLRVFQPALREFGRLWQENRINVADEHLASAITESAMTRCFARVRCPEIRYPTLLAACVRSERHHLGLRMLCDLLEQEGWSPTFLGCDLPADALARTVRERRPGVLALSAAIVQHVPTLREAITAVRTSAGERQPTVIVGGRAFLERPDLARSAGADLVATDASTAAELLRERFG